MSLSDWRPYRRMKLQSALPVDEAIGRLSLHIKPPVTSMSFGAQDDESFHGTLAGNRFTMECGQAFELGLRQIFFPVASGSVVPASGGCAINVQMRVHRVMESALAAVVALSLFMMIILFFLSSFLDGIYFILAVFLALALGFYRHFRPDALRILSFLHDTLEVQEME
jgi:hypothetical protein